jgi:hypothetical protein
MLTKFEYRTDGAAHGVSTLHVWQPNDKGAMGWAIVGAWTDLPFQAAQDCAAFKTKMLYYPAMQWDFS